MKWLLFLAMFAPGSAFGGKFYVPQGDDECEENLAGAHHAAGPLVRILDHRPLDPAAVIDFVASRPALRRVRLGNLFDHPLREGLSLRTHVIRTLNVFKAQEQFYQISPELKRAAMLALILRHATAAMINHDFQAEHGHLPRTDAELKEAAAEVDDSIAAMTMMIAQTLGLDESDVAMVYIMSWGEHIEEVLTQTIAPEAAIEVYREMQRDQSNGQNLREWFAAKTLMFIAENKDLPLTIDPNGRLRPASSLYDQLEASLEPIFRKRN